LHLYDGYIPTMKKGDILGHEFMGEVVDVGPAVTKLKVGDRVVVPFPIACGNCNACAEGLYSVCENSNPNAAMAEKLMGHSPAGIFGYSHMLGGYPGGQAEYARVPFADIGPLKIENGIPDEQVLFLSDIFPTGYMGAEMCDIKRGDIVAVWGAGPVGQFAVASAYLLGAERVIAIDRYPYRLRRAAIMACKNGGTVSVIGVYGGFIDKFPMGSLMNRSLTVRTGQCHVQKYMKPLLKRVMAGDIDPSFVVSHRMALDDAPLGYEMFKNKEQDCNKVVLKP
jgi:threonine dehydrogenase-like Zn-dependent dehydrogenase